MNDFLYITSPSYSGSTLLTFLLNTHPDIATIGELKGASMDVELYHCSCGEPIGRCSFWQDVVRKMREKGEAFDLTDKWTQCGYGVGHAPFTNRVVRTRHRTLPLEMARSIYLSLSPSARAMFKRVNQTNVNFVRTVFEITGKRVFLDSSKDAMRLKYLSRIPEFRMKVIHLVRDGRGGMLSFMKHEDLPPDIAAREWLRSHLEIREVMRIFDHDQCMVLKYEDLCSAPDATMERIFDFVGVDPQAGEKDYRAVEHHILGNAMRFGSSSEIRLDTKWVRELNEEQIATFERVGGWLNRQFGYDSSVPTPEPVAT